MILEAPPLIYRAEVPVRKRRPQHQVNFFDYAFLTTMLIIIAGGCLCVLDMASAQSTGQESVVGRLIANLSIWGPTLVQGVAKYVLLFAASVVNSALIVALVCSLRSLDRKVNQENANKRLYLGKSRSSQRGMMLTRESTPFILSPVFR